MHRSSFLRISGGLSAVAIAFAAAALPAQAAETTTDYVTAAQIASDGSTPWLADIDHAGAYSEVTDSDGVEALRLQAPSSADGIRVLRRYDAASAPADLDGLLRDASYTYRGANVNFQVELFFTPSDSRYGPDAGTPADRCTQAVGADGPIAGACYTVIKWEPFASASSWTTVDLTAKTAANSSTGTAGWKNTNRIGKYEKPGALIGNTLEEYLAQMSGYAILGAGVAIGSGAPGVDGWVRDVTFGGVTHRFSARPVTATSLTIAVPASVPAGYPVTATATVTPAAEGTVSFTNGSTAIGTATVSGGAASITFAPAGSGTVALHAEFTPATPDFSPSHADAAIAVVAVAAEPAAPPATSTDDLLDILATHDVDVQAATVSFENSGRGDLAAVDAGKPLTGSLPWTAADAFVDVYGYSTPVFIGTFPVLDGKVQLSGADVTALGVGGHHLVFVGQQSGALSAIALTVTTPYAGTPPVDTPPVDAPPVDAPPVDTPAVDDPPVGNPAAVGPPAGAMLANTGLDLDALPVIAGVLLILGAAGVVLARGRAAGRRAPSTETASR